MRPWNLPGGIGHPPHPDQARVIREARAREGWGQRQLADAVGISQPFLCRLETGKRALSPRTKRHLDELLDIDVPLPLIDFALTANGRREARRLAREAATEALRIAALPKFVSVGPAPPDTWQPVFGGDRRRDSYVAVHPPVDDARRPR